MEKIKKLKKLLNKENVNGYIIPKNDEFFGEYIPEKKDRLKYISNFSGSYGFALIVKNHNYLFVDGRYTLQANKESGKNFKIITIPNLSPKSVFGEKELKIGFDPKIITKKSLNFFFKRTKLKFLPLNYNLVDKIWKRKQNTKINKFYTLPKNSYNQNYNLKINLIINNLKKKNIDYQFISASENNAWLLNIRGKDTNYTPLPNCYILINKNKNLILFCDLKKISNQFKVKFNKIKFMDISLTNKVLARIYGKNFIIDDNTCSFFFENTIKLNNRILYYQDPIYYLKAIKTRKEIENIKKAHISDGVSLTKYLFWLKRSFFKKRITEISASQKLLNFRKKNKNYLCPSFPTISGTGPNGAIIHYKPTTKTNRQLKRGDIYLVDSGGQYKFGTTDVTRTISLQNFNGRIKNIFTRVLKGHIAVANFALKKNTTGSEIDIAARKYLKQINLNYEHGTGHGVGYFLNVHEGPHSISKNNKISLFEGMVVSNEPGYYEQNKFGIRIENLIYIKKIRNKKIFENLTLVPIDKDLINKNLLSNNEKKWINSYHKKVFNNLKPKMNKLELKELRIACSTI
jgi:Xaa-Pro aminopeptidase